MKTEQKIGIIFDMDGTLWDSSVQVAESWTEILNRHPEAGRITTAEDIQNVMGKTMDDIAAALFPDMEKEQGLDLMHECAIYENEYLSINGGRLYEGLEETLKKLGDKFPLYIVSNCQSGYIEAFLKYYGFEKYFKDIECFGNNGYKKGKNIRLLADRNKLDRFFYVGDIQGDYDSTMEAGGEFIHAAYGFGTINQEVPFIGAITELPEILEKLV